MNAMTTIPVATNEYEKALKKSSVIFVSIHQLISVLYPISVFVLNISCSSLQFIDFFSEFENFSMSSTSQQMGRAFAREKIFKELQKLQQNLLFIRECI
jgi:hypothetical protein